MKYKAQISKTLLAGLIFSLMFEFIFFGQAFAQETTTGNQTQTTTDKPPYEDRLHRVAELAGSMHYLSSLCKTSQTNSFRLYMQEIIDAETENEPERRKRLVAKYNMGYRAFSSVYTKCTNAARLIESNYRKEGRDLISDLLARYTN